MPHRLTEARISVNTHTRTGKTGLVALLVVLAVAAGVYWFVLQDPSDRVEGEPSPTSPAEGSSEANKVANLTPATGPADKSSENSIASAGTADVTSDAPFKHFATGVRLQELRVDAGLATSNLAQLEITVREGVSGTLLANHPLRIEPIVFRPGRDVAVEVRTDLDGRATLTVEAGERLRVLVFEEFRNVPMIESKSAALPAGTVGRLEITVPLPPIIEMWVRVVDDKTDVTVAGARVWLERLIRIGDDSILEVLIEERTDRRGLARLVWPDQPPVGGRAELEGVGETRFVPVHNRGTESEPFELRLGPKIERGNYGVGGR